MKRADATDPLLALQQIGQGDKRFLAQLAGVKALLDKEDWRGVTLGCRMLYRIAHEANFLDKVEPVLRPFFDMAASRFEKQRAAMVRLYSRLRSAALKAEQANRLARLMRVVV